MEKSGLLYFRDGKKGTDLQVSVCNNYVSVPLLNSSCCIHQAMCSQVFTCTVQAVTESQKRQVLEGCHSDELGGGHFGRDKTLAKVSERYYWLGMVNDVKEFCRTCDKCQRANRYSGLKVIICLACVLEC